MFSEFVKKMDDVILEAKKSKHVIGDNLSDIYHVIENYVKVNNLILSNVETLLGNIPSQFRQYTLYGDDIFNHANDLSNKLAEVSIYTIMYTNIKNNDFSITVKGSPVVRLFNIPRRLVTVINPIKINDMLIYPPEFELMEIYHKLYSPVYQEDWDNLQEISVKIMRQLINRKKILGGRSKKKRKKRPFNNQILLKWLKRRKDYVLVGVNAINILKESNKYHQKLQIITDTPIEQFIQDLDDLIFQQLGFKTSHKTHEMRIPLEPRLRKTVVSITVPGRGTIHIIDIFNSARYELIPYTVYSNLQIGYPNVLRMFMMLELWFIRILFVLKHINDTTLRDNVHGIFDNLLDIDNIVVSKYCREMYLGTIVDLTRYLKRQSLQSTFFPYIPEQYRYQKGGYRKITKKNKH